MLEIILEILAGFGGAIGSHGKGRKQHKERSPMKKGTRLAFLWVFGIMTVISALLVVADLFLYGLPPSIGLIVLLGSMIFMFVCCTRIKTREG